MSQAATKVMALWVLRRLRAAGFQALFAGGCVRDMLLGQRSSDYDVATNATPREVKRLFRRVLLVGAKFGVAMVIRDRRRVEVTAFRSDLSYSDGRRPDGVRFATARQDAARRDFTINGLFYDPLEDRLIDYVGGRRDLERKVIRTIGRPRRRFAEDYLRMIRAVRFAVRLGFSIAPATAKAIRELAPRITGISGERIFDELNKMLSLPSAADALRLLAEHNLAGAILPELSCGDLWADALRRVERLARRRDSALNLIGLLCELPPRTISAVCRHWGASNELRDAICWCAECLSAWQIAVEMPLHRFKRLLVHKHWPRLLELWAAEERLRTGKGNVSRRIARRAAAIPADQIAPPALVTGSDLKDLGLAEGPQLGEILRRVYDEQLDGKLATRQSALARAREMIASDCGAF
jgi:tRNA nucleotidyltransferase/poly(A) polymerase